MGMADDLIAMDNTVLFDQSVMPGIESVTYKPATGDNKLINAHVDRRPPEYVEGELVAPVIEVWIQNHGQKGVTSIDKNGDRINVANRRGGTARDHVISEVIDQDAGMWRLLLR